MTSVEKLPMLNNISFKKVEKPKKSVTLNKKEKRPKIQLSLKKRDFPAGNEIALKRMLKYLSPKDVINLSKTCWFYRKYIRDNINQYWHYQYLKAKDLLPIMRVVHYMDWQHHNAKQPQQFKVKCLKKEERTKHGFYSDYQRGYYGYGQQRPANHNQLPTYNQFTNQMDQILPENIIKEYELKNSYDMPDGVWTRSPWDHVAKNSCLSSDCQYYHNWKNEYYPYGHEIYDQEYDSTENYFFKYIDMNYEREKTMVEYRIRRLITDNRKYETKIQEMYDRIENYKRYLVENDEKIEKYASYGRRYTAEGGNIPPKAPTKYRMFCIEYKQLHPNEYGYHWKCNEAWHALTKEEQNEYKEKGKKYIQDMKDRAEAIKEIRRF